MGSSQQPVINWQVVKGDLKSGFGEQRILIIAQGSGNAAPKLLVEDVQPNEASSLLGEGSLGTRAYNRVRQYNKVNEIDVLPLAMPTGTKAEGAFKVTGSAQENKTVRINLGDDSLSVKFLVSKGETSDQIATNAASAINAALNTQEQGNLFEAAVDATDKGLVLISFGIDGEVGNGLVAKASERVLGCEFSFVEFSGGAGAFDTDGILDQLRKRYQTVIFDAAMDFDALETWLEARVNRKNAVLGGVGISMRTGSLSELKTFANAKNSQTMVVFGNCDEMKYCAMPILAAAEFGAKRALRMTDGAILGNIVLDAQEVYGGVNKASLPYHNTPTSQKQPKGELIIEQTQDLNDAGITLFVPSDSGVVLGSVVTLYKYDGSGSSDATFKFLNAVDTSLAVQEYLFVNTKKQFGQTRATNGDLVAGASMTNALSVRAYIIGLYVTLVEYALAQGGSEALKAFKAKINVEFDASTGFYQVFAPVAIVSQFRGLDGTIAVSYEFN